MNETERRNIVVTPTVDTAIYASGDQLGSLMTLTGALPSMKAGLLESLTILDKSKQKSVLNVLFFSSLPAIVSADNAALDITDAVMATSCIGYVPVASADYKDLANSSVATIRSLSMIVNRTASELYALMLCGGTPTYTSTSDLVLTFGIRTA
jgi:hypothetical protein